MARILVIDDDVAQLTVARLALELSGHTVETAQGGLAALAAVTLLGGTPVDAVVLDLEMPGLGGVEVSAVLKRTPGWTTVPYALVSGRDDVEQVARELGATAFRRKPFGVAELRALVTTLLAARFERRAGRRRRRG